MAIYTIQIDCEHQNKQLLRFWPLKYRIPIQKQQKYMIFQLFALKITLNRCLNTIYRLWAQDRIHSDPFDQFSDFDPSHRGVTGVIWGANLAQK